MSLKVQVTVLGARNFKLQVLVKCALNINGNICVTVTVNSGCSFDLDAVRGLPFRPEAKNKSYLLPDEGEILYDGMSGECIYSRLRYAANATTEW